ncbi:hypothetical protein BK004_00955 [bacterium CG10_46_32]|nr:MAG: hypothetical protein BK004_00955 [bacterium CG10_46_32]PIR56461.1 MAG: hypothetical protein COU73_00965 [Parcubacteria group bacterium CG10_big_fil_rev_8_21_14_0_10_46_32]
MLNVARRNDPVRTNWIDRVCAAIRDNNELRRQFVITNMVAFRGFVRNQQFGFIKASARSLEAGNVPTLLYKWQQDQARKDHDDAPSSSPLIKRSAPPDAQLHLLPFYAGVRGFRF